MFNLWFLSFGSMYGDISNLTAVNPAAAIGTDLSVTVTVLLQKHLIFSLLLTKHYVTVFFDLWALYTGVCILWVFFPSGKKKDFCCVFPYIFET